MRVSDFHFDLPADRIAERPSEPRDAARLLVYDRALERTWHRQVRDIGEFLRAGDLLVLNDTRVLPHRLIGHLPTGGRLEVLILERDQARARGYVKPARKVRAGAPIELEGGRLVMVPEEALGGGMFRFRLAARGGTIDAALEAVGRAPLPPYIRRDDREDPAFDRERYQTVFARRPGAVAAPTAGLHFTPELLTALADRGVETAFVTLHVGEGTFAPVRVERVDEHEMHEEVFELPAATADAVARARGRGGRVVAVGTTATRTLESCAVQGSRSVAARAGSTRLFLHPGKELRVVDALLTNFHLPESTLLMLVAAFAGRDRVLGLYREAIELGYRFYSYGDAMLLL